MASSHHPTDLEPIPRDDEAIENALREAHLPSLMAALVHLTGDARHLRGRPPLVFDFFGDGQGGLSPETQSEIRALALDEIRAHRDGGGALPPPPSTGTIREMMDFLAGVPIPERYVDFLMEELALQGDDAKAREWLAGVPDASKQELHVVVIGAGMSGIVAAARLGQAGIPYTVVEKNADVGGTWL